MVIAQTVESIFYMWRTTGDVKWRERGYGIFQAIEKYAKTTYGYSSLHGVDQPQVRLLNDMPRYVLLSSVEHKATHSCVPAPLAGSSPRRSNTYTCYLMIPTRSPSIIGYSTRKLILYLFSLGQTRRGESSKSRHDLACHMPVDPC